MSEGPVRLVGDRVTLRPVEPRDESTLREIHATPEVAAWWGEMSPDFPRDEPEAHRFAIELAGEVIGMVQFGEEEEPEFRHAWLDLFVAPSHSGRGLGTEALSLLAGHLLTDRGHHRLTIDPAAHNAAAIRSYEKAGFEPVGTMRSAWRDPDRRWRDVLLMELVRAPRDESEPE